MGFGTDVTTLTDVAIILESAKFFIGLLIFALVISSIVAIWVGYKNNTITLTPTTATATANLPAATSDPNSSTTSATTQPLK